MAAILKIFSPIDFTFAGTGKIVVINPKAKQIKGNKINIIIFPPNISIKRAQTIPAIAVLIPA